MTTTTQQGVATAALSFTEEDAAEQFLSRWSEEDPEKASQTPEDEDQVDGDDETVDSEAEDAPEVEADESEEDPQESDEDPTDDEDDSEDEEKPKGKILEDDAKVKLKVGDEEHEVSVKDLKRLYGQEAALTKKSQQVAEQRKTAEEANAKAAAQLDRIYQKAMARWEPYSKIDMLVASKQLDEEQFTALRAEAQAAYEDVRFITSEVDTFVQNANAQRATQLKEAAQSAVKVLQEKIPGWDQKVYDDVRSYAEKSGMPKSTVDGIVDPFALEMIHKAMQFDKAKAVVTKKVNKTPQKVLKTTKTVSSKDTSVDKAAKHMKALRSSGSTDDAAALFLARWEA